MPIKIKPLPPTSLLHELLRYDPETGKLFWRVSRKGWIRAGAEAGYIRKSRGYLKYRYVGIGGGKYFAHRIIWALINGECPTNLEIDHINGDGLDNREENFRLVNMATNQRNRTRQRNNTSGYTGVHYEKDKGKWRAQIKFNGRNRTIGCFDTAEEAAEAYKIAAERFGFHGNHGRNSAAAADR